MRPTDEDLLRRVAETTGGAYDPAPESIFAPTDQRTVRALPLWPYLLAAAAILLLIDVALRRIDLSLYLGSKST